MTYAIGNLSAMFRAHNTAQQAGITLNTDFTVDVFEECTPSQAGAGVHITQRAYVYGDLRTAGYSTEQQNVDTAFRNTTSMLSEGWQLRCNAPGTTCADDAIYGVVEDRAVLYHKNGYLAQTSTSDVEETRIFGVRILP